MAVQNYPPPKFVFNLATMLLHASVAVAVLQALPAAPLTSPLRWFELILAVLVADLAGALMVSRRDHQHRRLPGSADVARPAGADRRRLPGRRLRGHHRAAAVLVDPLVVAAHPARAHRRRAAVPAVRHGGAGGQQRSSGCTTSPAAWSRSPPTRPARCRSSRPCASCSTPSASRCGCRPTSTRSHAWSSSAENGGGLVRRAGRPRRPLPPARGRPPPTGPLLVSAWPGRRGGGRGARPRRGVSDLLGAPVTTAAGEPGYLEVCDRRSDVVSFADSDRAALDSMLTHVNAAIRQQQLLTQIRYDADHDRLTGLPNRQRLAAEIDDAARRPTRSAPAPASSSPRWATTPRSPTPSATPPATSCCWSPPGLLREHAPPQALLARMEGEQFAVLLPGLSLAATERAARRLREAAATRARVAGLDLEVTLTIGVAAAPVHGTDSGTLMQRADVALLAAAGLRRRGQLPPGPRPAEPAPAAAGHRARAGDGRRARSASSSSRSSTRGPPTSSRSRRWCAGPTRATARSRPTTSSTWPSRSAGSAPLTDHVLDLALARCRRWLDDGHRAVGGGQPLGALPRPSPTSSTARPAAPCSGTACPGSCSPWSSPRAASSTTRCASSTVLGRPARAGPAAVDGRLRHRLLLAVPAAPAADRRGQDRQVLRAGHVAPARASRSSPARSSSWRTTWACASSPRASRTS